MGACNGACCGHDLREYELVEIGTDPNSRLILTNNHTTNEIVIRHIKSYLKKIGTTSVHDMSYRPIEDSELILKLKVLSGNLQSGSEICIMQTGFKGGYRRKKDGTTYFGCKKRMLKNNLRMQHGVIVNDIVIKLREKAMRENFRGRHFKIYYKENSYYIRDLGVGFGTFIKIEDSFQIRDGNLFTFGDSFMMLNLISDKLVGRISYRLKITIYSENCNDNILYNSP